MFGTVSGYLSTFTDARRCAPSQQLQSTGDSWDDAAELSAGIDQLGMFHQTEYSAYLKGTDRA